MLVQLYKQGITTKNLAKGRIPAHDGSSRCHSRKSQGGLPETAYFHVGAKLGSQRGKRSRGGRAALHSGFIHRPRNYITDRHFRRGNRKSLHAQLSQSRRLRGGLVPSAHGEATPGPGKMPWGVTTCLQGCEILRCQPRSSAPRVNEALHLFLVGGHSGVWLGPMLPETGA